MIYAACFLFVCVCIHFNVKVPLPLKPRKEAISLHFAHFRVYILEIFLFVYDILVQSRTPGDKYVF